MAVTNIGRHDILLGTDWFRAHNPQIDWAQNQLRLDRCPTSCYHDRPDETSNLAHLLPTEDLEAHYDDLLESKYQGIDPTQCILAHLLGEYEDMIQPNESVVTPTVPSKSASRYASPRTGPVVTSMVPSKLASRNASPQYGPVVTSTVPPKSASWHAPPHNSATCRRCIRKIPCAILPMPP